MGTNIRAQPLTTVTFLTRRLECPHCQQPGVTVLRKLCLGPALPTRCKACNRHVGIPYWTMLLLLPYAALMVGWPTIVRKLPIEAPPGLLIAPELSAYLSAAVVLSVVHGIVTIRWVPLEKR